MGAAGKAHVAARFSRAAFAASLEAHCKSLLAAGAWPRRGWLLPLLWAAVAVVVLLLGSAAWLASKGAAVGAAWALRALK
jgi:hypothetical protein